MEPENIITALVGERAAEMALAQATPGTEVCREKGIPYSPLLSVKQNAAQLRILLDAEGEAWFRELMETAELKKRGWGKPFPKDQPGLLRLWGILTALLTRPVQVLALNPMAGMTARDREAFGRLLSLCAERGIVFRYTSERLQDVLRLGIPQQVCFAVGDSWRKTDTSALVSEMEAAGADMSWEEVQRSWEAREDA